MGELVVIMDEHDTVLVAVHDDGSVTLPDPERVGDAAAIFWREVRDLGLALGVRIIPAEETSSGGAP